MTEIPLPAFELESREPLESELTRKLMHYLTTQRIQPGQRLPSERQMVEALGVGRASLRHSLKALSLLGVVEMRASTGTFMRNGSSDLLPAVIEWGVLLRSSQASEAVEARSVLEVTLAGLAAERRTEADVHRLRGLVAEMSRSGSTASDYIEWDVQFHLAVADTAGNQILAGVLRSIQSLLRVWATRVIDAAGETESSLAMHTPVLNAIVAGDADAARSAMQAHMDRASRRLRAAIEAEARESEQQASTTPTQIRA